MPAIKPARAPAVFSLREARRGWAEHLARCGCCRHFARGWGRVCDQGAVLLNELRAADEKARADTESAR